jgi:TadE-like protein
VLAVHRLISRRHRRGQAMVELALILPLFLTVIVGIISLGIGVFYQQQLTNAAREAARYAVIHSATSDCPTTSWLDPDPVAEPASYYACDTPQNSWPQMSAFARGKLVGLPPSDVKLSACWSGYWTKDGIGNWAAWDAPPPSSTVTTYYRGCTISGLDPRTNASALACPAATTASDDMASDLAVSTGTNANEVTAYACYDWRPPLAGFLVIPQVVHLRAVITQAMEYQQ